MDTHKPLTPVNNLREDENLLIQKTFSEELLLAMRSLFYGLEFNDSDKTLIRAVFSDPKALVAVRRRFLPKLDTSTPIGSVGDAWIGVEENIYGAHRDTIKQAIGYKELVIDMTEKALQLLENPDGQRISLKYQPELDDELGTKLLARNMFIKHVESQLNFLKIVMGNKPKELPTTGGKKGARINTNSAK